MSISKLERRIFLYLFVWLITTSLTIVYAVYQSKNSGAPSASAWLVFLPYLLPIFAAQALIYTVPLIIVGEAALALYKLIKGDTP